MKVITSTGENLPAAWEKAVRALWLYGGIVSTDYDRPGDPPSKDATMVMIVENPTAEPRIHRCFPDSLEGLEAYKNEVLFGIENHGYSYTYHERMDGQWEQIRDILTSSPYSRRAQVTTWRIDIDLGHHEPPCFQRGWFRLLPDDEGYRLIMNLHWRSRDALKAAFMNLYAFSYLQEREAAILSERLGVPVQCGRIVDVSDSFHIYGKDFGDAEKLFEQMSKRTFEQRTWTTEEIKAILGA